MSLVNLKKIWLTAVLFLGIILSCLFVTENRIRSSIRGNLLFAGEDGAVAPFSKIEITRDDSKITVWEDKGLWRVSEADNYYAMFQQINTLIDNVQEAKIGAQYQEAETDKLQWTTVTLFDKQGHKTVSVDLSDADKVTAHLVRLPHKEGLYRSTWKTQLPTELSSWVRQPLLDFSGQDIATFTVGKSVISRREEGAAFYNKQSQYKHTNFDYVQIFNILNDLRYEEVRASKEFNESQYPNLHTIQYTTFDGLDCRLRIYTDYSEYWLSINLSMTTLPSNQVRDYITRNSIFFQNWWFRLPVEEGRLLFMFKL